jgi:hypothetical protein
MLSGIMLSGIVLSGMVPLLYVLLIV